MDRLDILRSAFAVRRVQRTHVGAPRCVVLVWVRVVWSLRTAKSACFISHG